MAPDRIATLFPAIAGRPIAGSLMVEMARIFPGRARLSGKKRPGMAIDRLRVEKKKGEEKQLKNERRKEER